MSKKYAVVTTVHTFRHRYVISEERLQMKEDDVLELFDKDNDYLSKWTKEHKLTWINHGLKLDRDDEV